MEFFQKYKKLFLIAAFLVLCLLLGYGIYTIFFRSLLIPEPSAETPATSTLNTLPNAGTSTGQNISADPGTIDPGVVFPLGQASAIAAGGLTKTENLSLAPSLKPTLAADGRSLQYYDQTAGKFYRIGPDGVPEALSDKTFYNVENITWAGSKDKAIIEYPDGANILYNFAAEKQITLPAHWKEFAFNADSSQIVMKSIGLDPSNRWLAIAKDDGSEVRALEPLGEKDATVYPVWSPAGQIAAVFTESRDFERQEVYFVGLNNENFKSTIVDGRGFQPKWSPQGDKLLYSVYSNDTDLKPSLWVVGAQGEKIGSGRKRLNIETWPDKCTFAGPNELFCAVPENLPKGAGLFKELADGTKDNIYKIDITTGVKKLIAIPDGAYTMSDLAVSENGDYLFFTDKTSRTISKIRLK